MLWLVSSVGFVIEIQLPFNAIDFPSALFFMINTAITMQIRRGTIDPEEKKIITIL